MPFVTAKLKLCIGTFVDEAQLFAVAIVFEDKVIVGLVTVRIN